MSTEAVKWAMDDAPMLLTGRGKPDSTARQVLQVLGEHAHKDGTNAYPSVMRVQYRTGLDERTVRRALRRLEDGKLIAANGTVNGCTNWTLAMGLRRPPTDWEGLEAAKERDRAAVAERVRRHRSKRVTGTESVTVTDSGDVTTGDVTHSDDVSNALKVRDVTDSASVCNALNAPRTTREPSLEPPENRLPSGRRPTTGSGDDPESGYAADEDESTEKVSAADVRAVVAGLPQPVRTAIADRFRHTPPMLVATIRGELARGLTAQRITERATDRWHQRYADTTVRRPLGVAEALLRNDCTSPRCDDGTDLDTTQPCRTCERAREDAAAEKRNAS